MDNNKLTVKDLAELRKTYPHFPVCVEDEDGQIKPAEFTFYHSFGEGWILEVNSLDYLYESDKHTYTLGTWEQRKTEHTQSTLFELFNSKWFTSHMYSDIPVYAVRKYCMFQRTFSKVRVDDGQVIFYNDKEDLRRFRENQKKENDRFAESCKSYNMDNIKLPIVRNCKPQLLADKLVSVSPIPGPIKGGQPNV